MTEFNGFPKELFGFFTELAENNNREWFNANKERYRQVVVDPMVSFIAAMAPRLEKVSSHFVADPRPNGGSLFRIYRDVRFSKDKRPYKEHAACHFRHAAGRDAHVPGFYVHLEPGQVIVGGGIWKPPSPALARIRDAIDRSGDDWESVRTDSALVKTFGGIGGDGLSRPPKGYADDHRHIEDLKRKSFFAMARLPETAAGNADFADRVGSIFSASAPLGRFICRALDQPF